MGIFSGKKEEKKLALVFDLGSSSVGGAVFEMEKSGTPKIILSIREPIILEEKFNEARFLFLSLKSLDVVAGKICRMGIGKPARIFCVLSSPWYASQTRIIKLEKNVPFLFTSKLADELIKKEISLLEEEHLAKFSQTHDKIRPIEFKNVKIMLNGYPTSAPFGKKTKTLEMIIFVSMSSEQVLKKIEDTIFKHFHSKDIKFSSFAMASFTVARDMFAKQESFLLVDIGGEMTDISMIKKDILSNSISYPLGPNFMVRGLANSLNCILSEAKSLISLYRDEHALESTKKKLDPIINKLKTEWLNEFQKSLKNLSSNISVPATIFVTVDQDLADFFSKIIKAEQFGQNILTASEFKIIVLDPQTLHGITLFKDNVNRDPFLIIESVYINRFIC